MYESASQADPQGPESYDDNCQRVYRGGNYGPAREGMYLSGYSAYRGSGSDTVGGIGFPRSPYNQ